MQTIQRELETETGKEEAKLKIYSHEYKTSLQEQYSEQHHAFMFIAIIYLFTDIVVGFSHSGNV